MTMLLTPLALAEEPASAATVPGGRPGDQPAVLLAGCARAGAS